MLILYETETCPYCALVRNKLSALGLEYESRNTKGNSEYRDELINRGGKNQVPYFVDTSAGVEMYESMDIINYLEKNYA